jgi:hypothetical protein
MDKQRYKNRALLGLTPRCMITRWLSMWDHVYEVVKNSPL